MINKNLFLKLEGNKYYQRNKKTLKEFDYYDDKLQLKISDKIKLYKNKKIKILEIGCGNGGRLVYLKKKFPNIEAYGLEPSTKAISSINKKFVKIKKATADYIPFPSTFFDIVVFGFCLYLVDDENLFATAMEADRVLKNKSWLLIKDFEMNNLNYKKYKHNKKIKIRKMDHSKMFLWSPYMKLSSKEIFSHDNNYIWTDKEDNKISVTCIRKYI